MKLASVSWTGPLDQQEQKENAAFGFVPPFHAPRKKIRKHRQRQGGEHKGTRGEGEEGLKREDEGWDKVREGGGLFVKVCCCGWLDGWLVARVFVRVVRVE